MPISLQKGQKVSLTKGNPGLTKVVVGLGWDVNSFDTGGLRSRCAVWAAYSVFRKIRTSLGRALGFSCRSRRRTGSLSRNSLGYRTSHTCGNVRMKRSRSLNVRCERTSAISIVMP